MLELAGKRLKENRDVRTGWQEVERKPKCQRLVGKRMKENRNIRTGWQVVGKKNEVSELVSKRLGRTRKEKKRKKFAGQPFDGTDGKFNKSISLFLFFLYLF